MTHDAVTDAVEDRSTSTTTLSTTVDRLVSLSLRGLPQMYRADSRAFVQTVRGAAGTTGPRLVQEGTNLRYAAIVALGLHHTDEAVQRQVLSGITAAELSAAVAKRAERDTDPGAVALAAWAAAEVEHRHAGALFGRVRDMLASGAPMPTVDTAWMLSAAVAAAYLGDTDDVVATTRTRLLVEQGPHGIFPHALPAGSLGRLRAHVGCFADQVYPIQALARMASVRADSEALVAANACARRIRDLQGAAGQWWWHYDARDGTVVEGFPVYSVHQHAMAPMALFDLFDAGGDDHRDAVVSGLSWLTTHPEVLDELVDDRLGVVWRKVGRREPSKAARTLNAVTTAFRPGFTIPGQDRAFPTTLVDHECRPYELGWLLYAWLRHGTAATALLAEESSRA
ncbi:MAG: hypothetical protein ABI890_12840 [Lapillicoccus sp.]